MKVPYQIAQHGIAKLKSAIFLLLKDAPEEGMRNSDIGRALGIGYGHSGKHKDHIPRVMLEIMKEEGVVLQDSDTKMWRLNK